MAEFWYSSSIGRRPTMEDEHVAAEDKASGWQIFAVCDGHGGRGVVNRLAQLLAPTVLSALARATAAVAGLPLRPGYLRQYLKRIVVWIDRKLNEEVKGRARGSGSTLLLLVYNPKTRQIAVANVGDSRAVVQFLPATATALPGLIETRDHKPDDPSEMARVAEAGSYIVRKRVAGILAMTRAMGDFSLKRTSAQRGRTYDPLLGPVSALADVQVGSIARTARAVVVLACDGIWDVMNSGEAVAVAAAALTEDAVQPAQALVDEAYARGSTDNLTALVIKFPSSVVATKPTVSTASSSSMSATMTPSVSPSEVATVSAGRAAGGRARGRLRSKTKPRRT